jgi:hypothetical protein
MIFSLVIDVASRPVPAWVFAVYLIITPLIFLGVRPHLPKTPKIKKRVKTLLKKK